MAGYVARDKAGVVSAAQVAPSSRWVEMRNTKGSAFSLTPDTTDNFVYNDELLNFLVNRYGLGTGATGIRASRSGARWGPGSTGGFIRDSLPGSGGVATGRSDPGGPGAPC